MKRIFVIIIAFLMIAAQIAFLSINSAQAAVNYNRIIDDSVFNNNSSMTIGQIDAFLNTFPNSCISTNKLFGAPDPSGYNPSDGFLYGGNVSAGRVIYDAGQAYNLNPQVLLTTLQKEQSLITGDAGCSVLRYTGAMGYGCPDGGTTHSYSGANLYSINGHTVTSVSGTCVNTKEKAGFSQQVIHAAWLLKFGQQRSLGNTSWAEIHGSWDNSDDPPTCYGGPMTEGYRKRCSSDVNATFYDGYTTIDGSSVHMDTGATASLYWYTPHKAGNSHFFDLFTGWFGPPFSSGSDVAFAGDWDGDGKDTIGVKRGNFYSIDVDGDGYIDQTFTYGVGSETPLIGDWDGNGRDSIALRTTNKIFINNQLDSSSDFRYLYANTADKLLVGDWDGNGTDTVSLWTGTKVFINNNFDSYNEFAYKYGSTGYSPLVGDWNGDGRDTVSVKIGTKYFINNGLDSYNDFAFRYGVDGYAPLVGDWDGNGTDTIGLKTGNKFFFNNQFDDTSDSRIVFLG